MIAIRAAMLAVATVLTAAALGTLEMRLQPSAQRLVITAVTGLLAPLFWPGLCKTLTRTVYRIVAWSAAAAAVAFVLLRIVGGARQPFVPLALSCAMLILVLLVTHALAAGIERRLRNGLDDSIGAREMAGRSAAVVLAVVGGTPLWLGPTGELLAGARPWITDAVIALSPLTHLAVASGNDLLRNQWLYDHSNLAKIAVSYPGLRELLLSYVSILSTLALASVVRRNLRRRFAAISVPRPTKEDARS